MVDASVALFLLALGVFGVLAYLYFLHEKKRREQFQQAAQRLGLHYELQSTEQLPQRLSHYSIFQQGYARRALNVLRGTYRGQDVRLFEFQYKTQTHNGKQTQTQTHHVGVAVAFLGQPYPTIRIVPESVGHKLWDALGGDDIDFESDEFSRKFWVKSGDRRTAYDLIHPRMMEYLMQDGWQRWELATPAVCAWHNGRLRPDEAQRILDRLVGFVEIMPRHVARASSIVEARG